MSKSATATARRGGTYRPPVQPRWKPTTELKNTTVKSMRNLARNLHDDHPDMGMHLHLRDAAAALERGNSQAAVRHLTAAIGNVTPQSLHRHGIRTDEQHAQAKANMDAVHRHLLLVKELQDHESHNENLAAISRQATADALDGPDKKKPDQMEGYGPGRLSAVPTARQPTGNQAMNAPGKLPTGGPDASTAKPIEITTKTTHQIAASWDDLDRLVYEFSAQTGRLSTEPSPLGKPGGPGLWHVKNMQLPPYIQHIAKALMEKRGFSESHAIATARAATKRWKTGRNTKPEVRAASGLSDAEWRAKQMQAHAHSWEDVDRAIELAAGHPPYRYRHGWVKLDDVSTGLPPADRRSVSVHQSLNRSLAAKSQPAAPGTAEHSAELKGLAARAELRQQQNYRTLKASAEGTQSMEATRVTTGSDRGSPPSSDAARALRRAATMIDRGQPSLARVHSGAIREAAAREAVGDPAFRDRLNAAADKLDKLPRGQGALAERATGADEADRTAAARAYAARAVQTSWEDIDLKVLLFTGTSAGAAKDPRAPTGKFGSGQAAAKNGKPAPKGQPSAHAQHVQHQQHQLNQKAANDRQKARGLIKQRNTLQQELASASGATNSGQAGSTTSGQAGSTTASNAAASTSAAASTTAATTPSLTQASGTPSSVNTNSSAAAIKSAIGQLNTQITQLLTAAAQATAQAKALK